MLCDPEKLLNREDLIEIENTCVVYPLGLRSKLSRDELLELIGKSNWTLAEAVLAIHGVGPKSSELIHFWRHHGDDCLDPSEQYPTFADVLHLLPRSKRRGNILADYELLGRELFPKAAAIRDIVGDELASVDSIIELCLQKRIGPPASIDSLHRELLGHKARSAAPADAPESETERLSIPSEALRIKFETRGTTLILNLFQNSEWKAQKEFDGKTKQGRVLLALLMKPGVEKTLTTREIIELVYSKEFEGIMSNGGTGLKALETNSVQLIQDLREKLHGAGLSEESMSGLLLTDTGHRTCRLIAHEIIDKEDRRIEEIPYGTQQYREGQLYDVVQPDVFKDG